ncbi:MAG: hypothetical protein WKF91_15725 [Segetibacter sp.]
MTIDVSAVVAQFGAYYIDNGQNQAQIKSALYKLSETAALFTNRPTTDTYFRSTSAQMTSVLQPFQKLFTPKGILTFTPNAFPLFNIKIDYDVFPDEVKNTYLGFFESLDEHDRSKWPLIRYIIENHILASKAQDMEASVVFGGKYIAPVAGVASPAANSMDGIKAVLKKYNTAGRLNFGAGPLAMGVPATDPVAFCTQVEGWVDAFNPELRKTIDFLVMSETLATRFKRGKRLKYGAVQNYLSGMTQNDLTTIEDYSSINVKGFQSHNGSTIIWATPKVNRIRPVRKAVLENTFKVEVYRREVSIYTDWWEALEFEIPELVVVNDSADLAAV